jgi:Uma2 family endonuclease
MAVQTRMTAKEFWELPESNQFIELIHGEVIMSPSPIPVHQRVVFRVGFLLEPLSQKHGGTVYIAPLSGYLDDENIPQPDVIWIAPNSKCTIGEKYLIGAPDLVVEVFSPSTALRDKTDKFKLYEKHGVREYWMLGAVAKYIEVWQLENGKFVQKGVYGPGATFTPAVFSGEMIDVAAIFA